MGPVNLDLFQQPGRLVFTALAVPAPAGIAIRTNLIVGAIPESPSAGSDERMNRPCQFAAPSPYARILPRTISPTLVSCKQEQIYDNSRSQPAHPELRNKFPHASTE